MAAIPIVRANYQSYTDVSANTSAMAATSTMTLKNPKNQTIVFYVFNGSGDPTEVTVSSVVDQAGRGGQIGGTCDDVYQQSVAAGDTAMFGPFSAVWWNQPNGVVNVAFSATADTLLVLGVQIA